MIQSRNSAEEFESVNKLEVRNESRNWESFPRFECVRPKMPYSPPKPSRTVEFPIVEVALTVPEAIKVISDLVRNAPDVIVGAGSVPDIETARNCLRAGVQFLASDGLDPETVKFGAQEGVVVIPGTLTHTEVNAAWKLRPDFVKVVPCGQVEATVTSKL